MASAVLAPATQLTARLSQPGARKPARAQLAGPLRRLAVLPQQGCRLAGAQLPAAPAPRRAAAVAHAAPAPTAVSLADVSVPSLAYKAVGLYTLFWAAALLCAPEASVAAIVKPSVLVGPVTLWVLGKGWAVLNLSLSAVLLALSRRTQITAMAAKRLTFGLLVGGLTNAAVNYAGGATLLSLSPAAAVALVAPVGLVAIAGAVQARANLLRDAAALVADALRPDSTNALTLLYGATALFALLYGAAWVAVPGALHSVLFTSATSPLLTLVYRLYGGYLITHAAMALVLRDAAASRALGGSVYRTMNAVLVATGAIALPSLHALLERGITTPVFKVAYLAYIVCLVCGVLGYLGKYFD